MLSILIVDDDMQIRQLLRDYLAGFGMSVVAVADGQAMAEALKKSSFDLVILDLMLPGEDGLTLCRNLRAESDVPILMLTARGEAMDRVVGLELGADDYIVKPFEPRELVARIQTILRRTRGKHENHKKQNEAGIHGLAIELCVTPSRFSERIGDSTLQRGIPFADSVYREPQQDIDS